MWLHRHLDTEVCQRDSWLEVFEALSKQERLETQEHVKGINYQIDAGLQPGQILKFQHHSWFERRGAAQITSDLATGSNCSRQLR